jgi:hypothetical protein
MNNWKVFALILLGILIALGLIMWLGYATEKKTQEKTMNCYYNICSEYPEAQFDSTLNLCSCYDYDVLGKLKVGKQIYLK